MNTFEYEKMYNMDTINQSKKIYENMLSFSKEIYFTAVKYFKDDLESNRLNFDDDEFDMSEIHKEFSKLRNKFRKKIQKKSSKIPLSDLTEQIDIKIKKLEHKYQTHEDEQKIEVSSGNESYSIGVGLYKEILRRITVKRYEKYWTKHYKHYITRALASELSHHVEHVIDCDDKKYDNTMMSLRESGIRVA